MKRILVWWIGLPTLVLAVLFAALLAYRAHRQSEVAEILEISTPHGIQEGMFIPVGGIDQWITIRGEDRDNPVILLVHGGPGLTTSPVAAWLRSWEHDFTVVHWDQRGAGKTYGRYGAGTPDMSAARIIKDGYEVAEFLRDHLHTNKIILVGHSWGAAVGVIMAQRRPDLFAAYVGTGQPVDTTQTQPANYDQLLKLALAAGDQPSIAALEEIGRPPYGPSVDTTAARRVGADYSSPSERNYFWRAIGATLSSPGMTWRDLDDNSKGTTFSDRTLLSRGGEFEIRSSGLTFQIPMFFIQGDRDFVTPTPLVEDYVRAMTAPHKAAIVIPGGGHNVMLAMPEVFLEVLVSEVRPVVTE